jgi:type 1 glutamine amidotransferase
MPARQSHVLLLLLLGSLLFSFSVSALEPLKKHAVLMIGEDEYHTWETLPDFAKTELEPRGFIVTVILEDPAHKHHFPGLIESLAKADLLILSTRRRLPPKDQLDAVRGYLDAGKPLVALRTACHAFAPPLTKGKPKADPTAGASWIEFDADVLGGHYTGHHGPGPKVAVTLAPNAEQSPLLQNVDASKLIGNGSLYKVSPIGPSCTALLVGTLPEKPTEPLAWTHLYGPSKARIFYTSLGHPDDFKEPPFRQLLLNAIAWAVNER